MGGKDGGLPYHDLYLTNSTGQGNAVDKGWREVCGETGSIP